MVKTKREREGGKKAHRGRGGGKTELCTLKEGGEMTEEGEGRRLPPQVYREGGQ